VIGALLFISAGRLDWWEAWAFMIVYFLIGMASMLLVDLHNPALADERSSLGANTKRWDVVIMGFYALLAIAQFPVIGFDAGRFHASSVPPVLRIVMVVIFLGGEALPAWTSYVNPYLSGLVRIQADRGHHVIDSGPYRFIRHPMYLGMIALNIAMPLLLGSYWALIVSALIVVVLVIRTALEDRTLHAELPGYPEYAARVRCRLLPGIW
jgi:protein-S-isoprenylcysteine O-methyltransferase Ste14